MFGFNTRFYRAVVAVILVVPTLAWATLEAGTDAYNGGDYALAMHELLPLAEKGNGDAQYFVGQMYANGQSVPKSEATAANWFLQSAGNGNANAQLTLGDMYAFGRGIEENDAIAAYWHWRAAITFVATARRNLNGSLKNSEAAKAKTAGQTPPSVVKCTPPSYVHDVQHFGEGSTMDLLFLVDADGKILDTSVLNSSDWARLDQIARDAFSSCTFSPARVDGKPVPGVMRMPYVWKTN
ncbi:MAG TPA: TonB family protein [Burkholderiaceae bacterium]|jgi:TonB family protein|nr:TonB family protein [Burkholderiaceae bacterium]